MFIAHMTLPKADGIRVVSERIQKSIPYSTTVLPIYNDFEKMKASPITIDLKTKYPQFKKHILMISRLATEKNIPLALQIFKNVLKDVPDAGLIIAGSGPLKESLKKITAEFGIADSVMFEPWSEDVASFYKTADLFFQTSLYEGYGLTLVEAALLGCPIVTSQVGIVGSVLGSDSCMICEPLDQECFRESIVRMLTDESMCSQLINNAKQAIEKHLLSKEAYLEAYKKELEKMVL
jgi:glycosyltransferase involved in cell wall biosynthesis